MLTVLLLDPEQRLAGRLKSGTISKNGNMQFPRLILRPSIGWPSRNPRAGNLRPIKSFLFHFCGARGNLSLFAIFSSGSFWLMQPEPS